MNLQKGVFNPLTQLWTIACTTLSISTVSQSDCDVYFIVEAEWMHCDIFSQTITIGHLGPFHFFAIENNLQYLYV